MTEQQPDLKVHGRGRAGHYFCGTPIALVGRGVVSEPESDDDKWTCLKCITEKLRRAIRHRDLRQVHVDLAQRRVDEATRQYDVVLEAAGS